LENGEDSSAHLGLFKALRRIGLGSTPVSLCGENRRFLERKSVMLSQVVFKTKRRMSLTRVKELPRRIDDNAMKPRGKRLNDLEAMAIPIDLEKTLLGNVLGA